MEQRLSLVTLGVENLGRAVAFYEALGWRTDNDFEEQDVAFFQAGGMVVALWWRDQLAKDSGIEDDEGGWGGVTLAYNVRHQEEVDSVIAEAEAAGAEIAREPGDTFYGGYSGIFIDPDGHPWEVAHNPRWTVHEDGSISI